ncbi:response regulator [Microcoleus sp. FACHB-SPT15]|uniref:response regulator n=1 Tax=Microcoleus sp. FACHB-SPT15 TaxID=2692830 RepID=UPI0017839D38|nr:response regulator [Microcoleus sp. FACHB-SPT15]MBD1805972.1 response regulator [Microcoleus sp. FACHB-SPT15]
MKILLVEDDELIGSALFEALVAHHYTVDVAADGQAGLELATTFEYDLILLDWLIPKLDGISVCRQLRATGYQKAILLLTAKDSNSDIVQGLDAGADDYIVKPYELSALMARIRALLRRGNSPVTSVLAWGNLCLNPVSGEVTFGEQLLSLTPKEYSLLELFLRNPQRVFSRSAIIDRLWSLGGSPAESAVTVHIKELRQKLKTGGMTEEIIETVYGLGYRLKSPPEEKALGESGAGGGSEEIATGDKGERSQSKLKGLASISNVLERFRDTFAQQVTVLEQAKIALIEGNLSEVLRQSARQEAHKLAGAMGTFGYPEGSNLARAIEHMLMDDKALGREEVLRLDRLVTDLQQELTKPPTSLIAEPTPPAQTPLVLVVDDDRVLTEQLKVEATVWEMRIETAPDLTTARQKVAQTPPDVILLELTFPDSAENGLTLLRELAEQSSTIPVLALTGRDRLEDRVAVSRLGGRGFLHKPVLPEQIFKAIARSAPAKLIARILPQTQSVEAKVLVVDDDSATLAALSSLLRPWGFQVTNLNEPQRFWEVLTATTPDLLVLDLEMPTFSGIDLCQVVRQDPQWGDLPILVVTAHTDAESIQRVFAAGADDFINKPVVGPELVTRVTSHIERVRLRQKLKQT